MFKLPKEKKKKLTLKQRKFTAEYLKTGNGTKAAIKAGYSKKSAQEIASENLSKPIIQEAVASAAQKLGIDPEFVLGRLKQISDFNSRETVKTVVKGNIEIQEEQMIDANAAIRSTELLGKHLGIFSEKLEVTGKDGKDLLPQEQKKKDLARKVAFLLAGASRK